MAGARFEDERLKLLTEVLCEECGTDAANGTGRALHQPLLRKWFAEYHCSACGETFYAWRQELDAIVSAIARERTGVR